MTESDPVRARRLVFTNVGTAADLIAEVEEFLRWAKAYGPAKCLYANINALGVTMQVIQLTEDGPT